MKRNKRPNANTLINSPSNGWFGIDRPLLLLGTWLALRSLWKKSAMAAERRGSCGRWRSPAPALILALWSGWIVAEVGASRGSSNKADADSEKRFDHAGGICVHLRPAVDPLRGDRPVASPVLGGSAALARRAGGIRGQALALLAAGGRGMSGAGGVRQVSAPKSRGDPLEPEDTLLRASSAVPTWSGFWDLIRRRPERGETPAQHDPGLADPRSGRPIKLLIFILVVL